MAIPSTIINEYITKQKKELINNITTGKKKQLYTGKRFTANSYQATVDRSSIFQIQKKKHLLGQKNMGYA